MSQQCMQQTQPSLKAMSRTLVLVVFMMLLLLLDWGRNENEGLWQGGERRYSRYLLPTGFSPFINSSEETDLDQKTPDFKFPAHVKGVDLHRDCRHRLYTQYARRRKIYQFDEFVPGNNQTCPPRDKYKKLIVIIATMQQKSTHIIDTLNNYFIDSLFKFELLHVRFNTTTFIIKALQWVYATCPGASIAAVWQNPSQLLGKPTWINIMRMWALNVTEAETEVASFGGLNCTDRSPSQSTAEEDFPCSQDAYYCPQMYWLNRAAMRRVIEVSEKIGPLLNDHARHMGFCMESSGTEYFIQSV